MKKFTKVYKAPGYPVDPVLEEKRVWERKWQFLEMTEYMDGRTTMSMFPPGWEKTVAWKEIDEAVTKEMFRLEDQALKAIKWKPNMGVDATPKID